MLESCYNISIIKNILNKVSLKIASWTGSSSGFAFSIIVVAAWLATGPIYHFSNTWLILITAITDALIFLVVFTIQSTQSRDSKAIQLKLNELIVADKKARDTFIGLEELTDKELEIIDDEFKQLLADKDENHALHKLHKRINAEKYKRPAFSEQLGHQVGHLVENLFSPFNSTNDKKD